MITTAVWWFVVYDRQLTVAQITIRDQTILIDKLSTRVDQIDEHGTHFSQSNIAKDLVTTLQGADRIVKLEQANAQLAPRIERLDLNVQYMLEWVKEQKELAKHAKP